MLAEGTIVGGRYRIVESIGEGAMGAVYRAEHVHMHKPLAVKVLHGELSEHREIVERFEREAVAGANVDHPNVAAATDFGKLDDGSYFLVMEYLGGNTLRSVLAQGPMAQDRALKIFRGIVLGVGAVHAKGIVHRDLKPENIVLVDKDDDPEFPKVLDFGIAKVDVNAVSTVAPRSASAPLTRAGAVMGTPEYMPPEQALGEDVDARADLYSLGVILFEMLAGARPFDGGTMTLLRSHAIANVPDLPQEALERVDPKLAGIVTRLMAKTREERYASAAELLDALGTVDARNDSTMQRIAVTGPSIGTLPTVAVHTGSDAVAPALTRSWTRLGAVAAAIIVVLIVTALASRPAPATTNAGRPGSPPAALTRTPAARKQLVVEPKERERHRRFLFF